MKILIFIIIFNTDLLLSIEDIKQLTDTLKHNSKVVSNVETLHISWFWLGLCFITIIYLFYLLLSYYKKKTVKYNVSVHSNDNNTEESFDSFFINLKNQPEATVLYKELKRAIHPDRFPLDKFENKIANQLAAEIGKHKLNLVELKKIQLKAKDLGLI